MSFLAWVFVSAEEDRFANDQEAYLLKKEAEQILLLDLQHLRYLVKDFVRLRLRKIEEYPQYYATVAGARAMLTSKEQKVAEKLWELERKNFQERCLDKLARRTNVKPFLVI